jgi:riboflavin-specific deaminase-like protein
MRPRVLANFAISLDGKVSTIAHEPSLFSSARDKKRLVEIRAMGDALLLGAATLNADTMTMGLPDAGLRQERLDRGQKEYPLRVILSNSGAIDPLWKVFGKDFSPILIFTTGRMPRDLRRTLEGGGAHVIEMNGDCVNPNEVLAILRSEWGVETVVCEGGPRLMRSMLEGGCIDEIFLTWCPVIFGGATAPTLTGAGMPLFEKGIKARLLEHQVIEGECFLHYALEREGADGER